MIILHGNTYLKIKVFTSKDIVLISNLAENNMKQKPMSLAELSFAVCVLALTIYLTPLD
jgi:hypothetical protein